MALYNVRFADKTMELIVPTTFSASGIRERQDLQAVLRDNPEAIAPGLMLVSEEFSILLASSFSKEVTTTVMWLNERDLAITCMQCRVYDIEGKTYLDLEQVIPLPSASDYQVRLRDKAIRTERAEAVRARSRRSVDRLIDAGILVQGMCLRLVKEFRGVDIPDPRARFITFTGREGRQSFRWDYNDQEYPNLSAVCNAICSEWGSGHEGGFDSAKYWAIGEVPPADGKVDTLFVLAERLMDGDG